MDEYSNIDEVIAALDKIVEGFGFDLTTGDKDLGQDCAGIFAEDVQALGAQGIGSEGEWPANEDEYAAYKERVYGVVERPNVRTNQMLSQDSLQNHETSHEVVDLIYGTGEPPRDGVAGRPVKAADKKVTDREKAGYAHTGQGPKGVKRPFYALHDETTVKIQGRCQERLNEYADEVWSA
jgi:hypothetical protein